MVNSLLNYSPLCSRILWFTFPFCNVHPVPDRHIYLTRACSFIKANSELWDGRLPPFRSRNTETICLETHYLALSTEGGFICARSKHFIAVQATSNRLRAVPGFTSGQACRCSITEPERRRAKDGILQTLRHLSFFLFFPNSLNALK